MSEFYCGLKPQKGKRLGTAAECLKANKVTHYGMQVIPNTIMDSSNVRENLQKQRMEVMNQIIRVKAKRKKLMERLNYRKYDDKKDKYENYIQRYTDMINELYSILQNINGLLNQKRSIKKWY